MLRLNTLETCKENKSYMNKLPGIISRVHG